MSAPPCLCCKPTRLVRRLEDRLQELGHKGPTLHLACLAGMFPSNLVESCLVKQVNLHHKQLVKQHLELRDQVQQDDTRLRLHPKGRLNSVFDQVKRPLDPLCDLLAAPLPVGGLLLPVRLKLEEVHPTVLLDRLGPIQHQGIQRVD